MRDARMLRTTAAGQMERRYGAVCADTAAPPPSPPWTPAFPGPSLDREHRQVKRLPRHEGKPTNVMQAAGRQAMKRRGGERGKRDDQRRARSIVTLEDVARVAGVHYSTV